MLELTRLSQAKKFWLARVAFVVTGLSLSLNTLLSAQQTKQKTFSSPEDASQALFAAAQSNDESALQELFGAAGDQIISSGDEVQDKNSRDQFVARYREMHRLEREPDGTTTLYIGAENWPLPVPLIEKNGAWYFDSESGKKDILFRRIGRNELATIDVLSALVDAQRDYYNQRTDGRPQYAQHFVSTAGTKNGLYWETSDGSPQSPIGNLIADAAREGYDKPQRDISAPFHGYFYRMLTAQGMSALGGAKSYIVNGRMTKGFAIIAYPGAYRSSGVMTFIVSRDGVIFQKDLGSSTAELAEALKTFAPDKTWHIVD